MNDDTQADAGQEARAARPAPTGRHNDTRQDSAQAGQRGSRPAPGGQQQQRRSTTPLSDGEMAEITGVCSRVPGLGRIVLGLVRNRAARVMVPETALGGELFSIVSELDRLSNRAAISLTRNLSSEKMQMKADFDLQAVSLIQPLAELTATLAVQFDNPQNPIVRHAETKRLVRLKLAAQKEKKESEAAAAAESRSTGDSKASAGERKSRGKNAQGAAATEPAAEVVTP